MAPLLYTVSADKTRQEIGRVPCAKVVSLLLVRPHKFDVCRLFFVSDRLNSLPRFCSVLELVRAAQNNDKGNLNPGNHGSSIHSLEGDYIEGLQLQFPVQYY